MCGACQSQTADHSSPYAGQQHRHIKSLSDDDINALNLGQGWGLAKAAELNGYPGLLHVLDMRAEINLSEDQLTVIKSIYGTCFMKPFHWASSWLLMNKHSMKRLLKG